MNSARERRGKYFVDRHVQGALLRQLVAYWLLGIVVFVTFLLIYHMLPTWLTGGDDSRGILLRELAPVLSVSAAVAPMVFVAAVRFSNRFVGPMLRFRSALRQLAQGETPAPIALRDKDYWTDIAADINEIIRIRQAPSVAHTTDAPAPRVPTATV